MSEILLDFLLKIFVGFGARDDITCLGAGCCMVAVNYSTMKNIHGWNRQIFLFLRKQLLSADSHLVTWYLR